MIVYWRRRWLARAIGIAAAVGMMTLAMAVAIAGYGFGDFGGDRRAILAAMFAAFALLLTAAAITYLVELVRFRWIVRLDDAGLHDRRLSRAAVPWRDIRAAVPVRHGMQWMLALDIADPRGVALPRNPLWQVNRLAARILGNPEMSVRITGLDTDLFAMMQAIETLKGDGSCAFPPGSRSSR